MKYLLHICLLIVLSACSSDSNPKEQNEKKSETALEISDTSSSSEYDEMFREEKRKEYLESSFKAPQIKSNILYVYDNIPIFSDFSLNESVGEAKIGESLTVIETTDQFDMTKDMFEGYLTKVIRENGDTIVINNAVLLNLPYDSKCTGPQDYFYKNLHLTDSVHITEQYRNNSDDYPDNEEGEFAEQRYFYEQQIEFSTSQVFVASAFHITLPKVQLLKSLLFYNHIPNIEHPPILSLTNGKLPTESQENIPGFDGDVSVIVEKDGRAIQSIYYMFGFDSHFIDIQFDIFEESGTLIKYSIGM